MKGFVRDGHWNFSTEYLNVSLSNRRVVEGYIRGLDCDLLKVVLKQMNMTLFHVPTPKGLKKTSFLVNGLLGKKFIK
jgi:hypothetical protein